MIETHEAYSLPRYFVPRAPRRLNREDSHLDRRNEETRPRKCPKPGLIYSHSEDPHLPKRAVPLMAHNDMVDNDNAKDFGRIG